jgi:hypothetical protein
MTFEDYIHAEVGRVKLSVPIINPPSQESEEFRHHIEQVQEWIRGTLSPQNFVNTLYFLNKYPQYKATVGMSVYRGQARLGGSGPRSFSKSKAIAIGYACDSMENGYLITARVKAPCVDISKIMKRFNNSYFNHEDQKEVVMFYQEPKRGVEEVSCK